MRQLPWKLAMLAIFVAIIWLRLPDIMRHGRFWAEEGHVYFANATTLPWWRALFKTELGYLNLPATAATLCARYLVGLDNAPHVTTAIALVLQCLPAIVLLRAQDGWLRKPYVLAAALLLLAAPVSGDEVWLNTINSQVHIALACALCLALEIPAGAWGRALLLFAGPLCSPVTVALAPLFLLRAAWNQDRARLIQAAAILAGALIQVAVFYRPLAARDHQISPSILVAVLAARHLALPLLGEQLAGVITIDLRQSLLAMQRPILAFVAVAVAAGGLTTAMLLRRSATVAWMLAAAAALSALSYYGALGDRLGLVSIDGSMRYAFAPTMLVSLAVLAVAATATDRLSAIAWLFAVWLLACGVMQTLLPHQPIFANGPRWRDQVALWRSDHARALAEWPSGWDVRLGGDE